MFARTQRLTLRPGWPEEADALTRAIAHEAAAMNLARVPWPYTAADAEAFLAAPRGATEPRFLILSHDADYPCVIGGIGLNMLGSGSAELGYWLTPDAWGRGYATEAARAVIHMARHALPLHRLHARHHVDNHAARRVLDKLGFREIARSTSFSVAHGRAVNSTLLSLSLSEQDGQDTPEIDRMAIAA